ncbi:hypothetical protein JYG23_08790 [Sedimentibacter sp. zth1]|nr:hypothetical protein JYG23_08790 [Sedimentibacter sp. zth1]
MYYKGKLLYKGEFKDSQYHGKGKLYFKNSTQLMYEDNFSY